jgi:hypothetical protein
VNETAGTSPAFSPNILSVSIERQCQRGEPSMINAGRSKRSASGVPGLGPFSKISLDLFKHGVVVGFGAKGADYFIAVRQSPDRSGHVRAATCPGAA